MKSLLASVFSVLAVTSVHAETLPPGTVQFPSSMICGAANNGERMAESYGELPFLQGDAQVLSPDHNRAYHGKIRVFLDPDDHSYTIFFDIPNEQMGTLTCLLVTGDRIEPLLGGPHI